MAVVECPLLVLSIITIYTLLSVMCSINIVNFLENFSVKIIFPNLSALKFASRESFSKYGEGGHEIEDLFLSVTFEF